MVSFPLMACQDYARYIGISRYDPAYAIRLDVAWLVRADRNLAAKRFQLDTHRAVRFLLLGGIGAFAVTVAWTALVYGAPVHAMTTVSSPWSSGTRTSTALPSATRRASASPWSGTSSARWLRRSSVPSPGLAPASSPSRPSSKLAQWNVDHKTIVVPNWAPIDELPVRSRQNAWSERHGLADCPVVLYSGTLGLKHDPSILAVIAAELEHSTPAAKVVVISESRARMARGVEA